MEIIEGKKLYQKKQQIQKPRYKKKDLFRNRKKDSFKKANQAKVLTNSKRGAMTQTFKIFCQTNKKALSLLDVILVPPQNNFLILFRN
jgi:hypothetical protein